jgi:cytochrome b561
MHIKNSRTDFGFMAISLHWLMALLIIGLCIAGLYMVQLPISLQKLKYYGLHKEIGLLVLGLAIIRLAWRLINITPNLDIPWWEKLIARLVHWAFYLFMIAMPITGWMMSSALGLPVSFFGIFVMPNIVTPNQELGQLLITIHHWLGFALMGLIVLHAAAAFKHHFVDKDDILRRMLS